MRLDLTSKRAIVTAGANGIGEGAAVALAEAGADIAILDIDLENAERVAERVRGFGRLAYPIFANALQPEQFAEGLSQAIAALGGVDILVNNAGGAKPRSILTQNARNWERIINLNLLSMISATHAVATFISSTQGGGGTIINIASSEALRAAPAYSVYAACKAGMVSFTKTMAVELAEHGIRVNCIAPDAIDTLGIRPPEIEPGVPAPPNVVHVPMLRMGSIEEIGSVIAFLASDMASFVTGSILSVDGGIAAASGWLRKPDNSWALS